MEWKILVPIIFISAILISGCADTKETEEEQKEIVEEVEETQTEEPVEENCATLAPAARIGCCQRKGYDGWDGEKCISTIEKSTTVSLESEDFNDNILEVYIKNTGNLALSLKSESITLIVTDAYAKTVCSGNLASDTIKCYSGCGGKLDAEDMQGLEVDLSNCGSLTTEGVYIYKLEFEGGASVVGSFIV